MRLVLLSSKGEEVAQEDLDKVILSVVAHLPILSTRDRVKKAIRFALLESEKKIRQKSIGSR